MNGVHDLGGMDGFGPVEVEAGEPVFHAAWERSVFALVAAFTARRVSNVHEFRHAIERMEPLHYLASSYYEHWLTALTTLLVEKGLLTHAELEARTGGHVALSRPVRADVAATGASPGPARFAVGTHVRVHDRHPLGHTRCPRYVRGKAGVIVRIHDAFPLPDLAAHGAPKNAEVSYTVRFAGRTLWGPAAPARDVVHVDLWESYLEALPP